MPPLPTPSRPLRAVAWGTYDLGKPRVRLLLEGLRRQGVEVVACHASVWEDVADKSQLRGWRAWGRRAITLLAAYPRLVARYLRLPPHDVVLVAYPGMVDLAVIRPWAWLRRTPLALDWFLSAYDTVVSDRRLVPERGLAARLLWIAEWVGCRLADGAFMDTRANAGRMERLFGLPEGRVGAVWVGAELADWARAAPVDLPNDRPTRVVFYGQLIPLHGIAVVAGAAAQLRDEAIDFLVVGEGQESARLAALLSSPEGLRVERWAWMEPAALAAELRRADVALGVFGASDKAAHVIPNKVFQILSVDRPLITRDGPAVRELVQPDGVRLQLIEAENPAALAAAILAVHRARQAGERPSGPGVDPGLLGPDEVGRQLAAFLHRLCGRSAP